MSTIAKAAGPAPARDEVESTRTTVRVPATADEVWEGLRYYEQVARRPPLHLRLLLPVPVGTEGSKSEPGDEALCRYDRGSLRKRITRSERKRCLGFDVVEQDLPLRGGVRLAGGAYSLRELPGGRTEVGLETRYRSLHRPRWLWRPIENAVCHLFHRYLVEAIRRDIEARRGA